MLQFYRGNSAPTILIGYRGGPYNSMAAPTILMGRSPGGSDHCSVKHQGFRIVLAGIAHGGEPCGDITLSAWELRKGLANASNGGGILGSVGALKGGVEMVSVVEFLNKITYRLLIDPCDDAGF